MIKEVVSDKFFATEVKKRIGTQADSNTVESELQIEIYANDEGTEQILKSIEFNFPVYKNGAFVRKILWDESVNVETLVFLNRKR